MIVLHATFQIKPDKLSEAVDLIQDLVEQSNQEDGMIEYRAAADVQDENTIRFFEQYEDQEAFEAHSQTDHFQEFEAELPGLLAGKPEVHRFDVESATELEL